MAASKKYAYYIEGNKLAIVEEGTDPGMGTCSLSNYKNQSACENAGGTWTKATSSGDFGKYKSPITDVSNGIELKYTYLPDFNLQSTGTEGTDFHRFIGWGSDGTNLLLFTFADADVVNLSSLFAADDWVYIEGSGRWSGLHQVKSTGGTTGILTLKTKCNLPASKLSTTVNFTTSETITGQTTAHKMDIEAFKDATSSRSNSYIYIDSADKAVNRGLFSLTSNTTSGQFTVNKRTVIDADGDYTDEAAATEAETSPNDAVVIYNAFSEQISVYEGVEKMEDESFEIDLPRYLQNAIVYYLKAKQFEDAGDFEKMQFYMREFKRQVEKHHGGKITTTHRIQGFWGMNKNY